MQATTNGTLAQTPVELADGAACCVIAASQGYPAAYEKGFPITMTAESAAHVYVAGARLQEGQLVTSGGRVLGVTAVADTLPEAVKEAYRLMDGVQFENRFFPPGYRAQKRWQPWRGGAEWLIGYMLQRSRALPRRRPRCWRTGRAFLGLTGLERIRIWNRYDAENIDAALFDYARRTVFSEPQLDEVSDRPAFDGAAAVFAVEPLPGQFDQRADSAAQCIQMLSRGERPLIRSAKVYVLYGTLSVENVEAVKRYVINRVESREASLELPETLTVRHEQPDTVETETGFIALEEAGLSALRSGWDLPWIWRT